jgi:hypothetical protein
MQRSPNDLNPSDRRFLRNWTAGILAGIILLVLVSLMLNYPTASEWISQAVQAEFVGSPPPVIVPTQIARPGQPNADRQGRPERTALSEAAKP